MNSTTFQAACGDFIKDRKRIEVAPNTLKGYEQFTNLVLRYLEPREKPRVNEFTIKDAKDFLSRWENPTSYNGKLVMLRTFLGFCKKQDWVASNVAEKIDKKKVAGKRPFIFGIKSTSKLIAAVLEMRPEAIAYYSLAIFAGIRDGEIKRMTWANINLAEGYITVDKAKTKNPRVIMLADCGPLAEWLKYAEGIGAPLPDLELTCPNRERILGGTRSTFQAIYKTAGFKKWNNDAMRHTFCSFHAAAFDNKPLTNKIAGHSAAVGEKFYESSIDDLGAIVTRKEAKKFWELTPEKFGK